VRTWGENGAGALGNGTTTNSSTPVVVSGLSDARAVQFGGHSGYAVKGDNTVWSWGLNWAGALGDNSTTQRSSPVQVSGLALAAGTKVEGGENHTLAVVSGAVYAWGYNNRGQLGDGTTTSSSVPVPVVGLTGTFLAVSGGSEHSIALRDDGTVWAWGSNEYGQLGNGSFGDSTSPVQVTGLSGVTAISAGYYATIALKGDGTVWAWGNNREGQLGIGSFTDRNTPVKVSGLSNVVAIDSGNGHHSLAVENDGSVWAWGDNTLGQIGNGALGLQVDPVEVTLP